MAHTAVVVEDGDAVSREPHVALQPGGAQPQPQAERLQRVGAGAGACPTVGEGDRGVQQGRQAGHASEI